MESIKIRNFYGSRILEKIHKTRSFISKIIYSFPFYSKLDLDETPRNISAFPPNFWKGGSADLHCFLRLYWRHFEGYSFGTKQKNTGLDIAIRY